MQKICVEANLQTDEQQKIALNLIPSFYESMSQ